MAELKNLLKKAKSGDSAANLELGYRYDYGKGVKRNSRKAVAFYRAAAENDSAAAQYNLGLCYRNGIGVKKREAFKSIDFTWYPFLRTKKRMLEHKLLCDSNKCRAILLLPVVIMTVSNSAGVAFRLSLLEFVSQESVHDLV